EYARRHRARAAVMSKHDLDHLLVVTDHRTGNAPQWVTGWPGPVEAYVVFRPGEKMTMHVEWYNHFPLAKRLARDVDVRWGEHRGMQKTIEELKRRGARRVGLMGPLLTRKQKELEKYFSVVELDAEYVRLGTIKSREEIDWLRIGAAFSDAAFESLLHGTKPGMTERELGNLVERAYVGEGGTTLIHYIGVTSMAQPQLFVPPQFHSARRVQRGDVVFCELSGVWWDYAGQVLRSFTVGADPTPLYRDLHAAAGRRAGRRADPRDARRLRAPARSAARFLPGMRPVLVVGAGPVGLATALSLAHQGVPVQVIEAEPALTLDQRAGSYHPPTLEMLAPFGVTEAMHEIGIKVPHWQIRDRRKGVIVEWDLGLIADLTPYPYRFHLEQHR